MFEQKTCKVTEDHAMVSRMLMFLFIYTARPLRVQVLAV